MKQKNKYFKVLCITLIGLVMASGVIAISMDTIIDLGCLSSMTVAFNPLCTPALYDDVVTGSPEDTMNDLYTKATVAQDGRDQIITEMESNLNTTFGIGMAEAKIQSINALNNGSTRSEAKTIARGEINDFYSAQELRVVNHANREALKWNESRNDIKQVSGLTYKEAIASNLNDNKASNYHQDMIRVETVNYTLPNGTDVKSYNAMHRVSGQDTSYETFVTGVAYNPDDFGYNTKYGTGVRFKNADGDHRLAFSPNRYVDVLDRIESRRQQANDNAINITDDIYDNYAPNSVNTSDVVGPLEMLKAASTSYDDTGYYGYRATTLEQAGIPTNDSYGFKIEFNDSGTVKTRWGQLFAAKGTIPNGTIETGNTYNATNKAMWFVHSTDGQAVQKSLSGEFTVLEMRNSDTGETVETTELQSVEMHTSGTEDLAKQLEEIREEFESLQVSSTGGGGGVSCGFLYEIPNVVKIQDPICQIENTLKNNGGFLMVSALISVFLLAVLGS